MIEKPSPEVVAAFAGAFPDDPRAARKKMFGMDCGAVNGNMFAGVFGKGVVARVGAARVAALSAAHEGVGPFEPLGRRWPEYVFVAAERWAGTPELAAWVREGLEHTAGLPAKVKAPKTAKKPRARTPS